VRGNHHAPFWNSGRRSDPPLDCNHPVQVAFTLGTDDGLMLDLQPGADRFEVVRGISPPAVRHHRLRGSVPETGRIQHHQGHPRGFGGGHHPRQHGPRVALEDDQTPPVHPVNGEVHAAAIDEPVLVPMRGFVGMKPWSRRHASFGDMRDIVVHQAVEGHHPPDRPHRHIRPG
jgi:hypothetical protein